MREFTALLSIFVSNLAKVCVRVKERRIGKSMHDTRPLLVFPSIGRIPYQQILDQRCRGEIRGIPEADRTFLYRVADMCSPGQTEVSGSELWRCKNSSDPPR